MISLHTKRDAMKKSGDSICPRIRKMLDKSIDESGYCSATWGGGHQFQVKMRGDTYVVNIDQKTCTCRK